MRSRSFKDFLLPSEAFAHLTVSVIKLCAFAIDQSKIWSRSAIGELHALLSKNSVAKLGLLKSSLSPLFLNKYGEEFLA